MEIITYIYEPKHMLWVLKRTVSMLKLMSKKILYILCFKILLISSNEYVGLAIHCLQWQEGSYRQVCVKFKVFLISGFLHKIVNIFLPITSSICFGCSKEPSH